MTRLQRTGAAGLGVTIAVLLALLFVPQSSAAGTPEVALKIAASDTVTSRERSAAKPPCSKLSAPEDKRPDCSGQSTAPGLTARGRDRPRQSIATSRTPETAATVWGPGHDLSAASRLYNASGPSRLRGPAPRSSRAAFWALFARQPKLRL
ncbi:MAG: hypothetical protein AAGJ53_04970 [Pseudomonadota bacterium]